jgi:general secretion pathway protein A
MYNNFYRFRESPFNITPDPRFLFFSERHREAFNHILFGVKERKGFIQITGEVGAGMTTVCRAILKELGPTYRTALVLNPTMTSGQLLRTILTEFALKPGRSDRVSSLDMLNEFLLHEAIIGNDVVLFIDEAQDLDWDLLEQVRLLSNLETEKTKLLQIVLWGSRSCARLEQSTCGSSASGSRCATAKPLSREDEPVHPPSLSPVAGSNGRPLHAVGRAEDLRVLRRVPRLINAVCDKTLLCGYVTGATG